VLFGANRNEDRPSQTTMLLSRLLFALFTSSSSTMTTTNRNNTGGGSGGENGNRGGKRNAVPAASNNGATTATAAAAPARKRTTKTKLASSARPSTGTNASSSRNSRAPPTTTTTKDPGGSSIDKKQKRENDRNKRVAQMNQSIKNKADGENQFFRQCRTAAAQRSSTAASTTMTRPMPTELELFGQQGSQGINFAKYNDIRVEVRRGQQHQHRRSVDDAASSATTEVVFPDDFTALPSLPAALRRNVARMNYASLTPIQKHAIPLALAGDDLMCCAQTGRAKLAPFYFPLSVDSSPRRVVLLRRQRRRVRRYRRRVPPLPGA
jgi:hypothetical protein